MRWRTFEGVPRAEANRRPLDIALLLVTRESHRTALRAGGKCLSIDTGVCLSELTQEGSLYLSVSDTTPPSLRVFLTVYWRLSNHNEGSFGTSMPQRCSSEVSLSASLASFPDKHLLDIPYRTLEFFCGYRSISTHTATGHCRSCLTLP